MISEYMEGSIFQRVPGAGIGQKESGRKVWVSLDAAFEQVTGVIRPEHSDSRVLVCSVGVALPPCLLSQWTSRTGRRGLGWKETEFSSKRKDAYSFGTFISLWAQNVSLE